MSRLVLTQITIKKERSISSTTWYYLLQPANASAPDATNYGNPPPIYSDTGYSGWSTTEPTYTVGDNRVLYVMVQTLYSDGTFSYSTPTISSSYEAAKDAYGEAIEAEATISEFEDLGLKRGYIWDNMTYVAAHDNIPEYPVGSYIASGYLNAGNRAINRANSNTYGLNTWISTGGIKLRYNAINLMQLTTSNLEFYYPSTSSQQKKAISLGTNNAVNSLVFYGFNNDNKTMELTNSALTFYNPTDGSTVQATLNNTGLEIKRGGVRMGTPKQNGFVYLSSLDYTKDVTDGITINNHTPENNDPAWRQIIGTKFGVDSEGNLYANSANLSGATVEGAITATSLTIGSGADAYNGYDAINISGYSIDITTESATAISANHLYLYPHLYHNGTEVDYYVLTEDTEPDQDKTYYYYDSTEEEYVAYTTAPSNPETSGAYESLYSKFIWFLNDDTIGVIGDEANRGRTLATYSDTAKVTFTFNDGATEGGEASVTVNVDPSKYITRISDTGIEVAPEVKTGNNKLAINTSSIDIYKNNVSMLHLEDSSGRFGDTNNYTKISSANGVEIYRSGIKRAQFDTDVNLYSSDQNQRLNLSTAGVKIYENNFNVASFGSSIELNTDFGGGISLFTGAEDSTNYVGFEIKGINGNNLFSIYDSDLGGAFNTINIDKYTNMNAEFVCDGWPLIEFIQGGITSSATSNTTTSIGYDGWFGAIVPYENRCYIRTGSQAIAFGRWVFIQLDLTIRNTTITKDNYWTLLSGAPAPATGYAALSAVAPARKYGNLSAYVTSAGSIAVVTGGADIPTDGRITITGFYLLAEEAHPPDVVWGT